LSHYCKRKKITESKNHAVGETVARSQDLIGTTGGKIELIYEVQKRGSKKAFE